MEDTKKNFSLRWFWLLISFFMMLTVYVNTLLPGVVGGDAGEQQFAGYQLILTHPTGTPLYLLTAYLWTHLVPIGSIAYRMNLLAAVAGALGCAIMTLVLFSAYRRAPIALACGVICGLGATYWGQAVIADKYAFAMLWAVIVVGAAILWAENYAGPQSQRALYVMCLLYGLSFLHHRTTLLFTFGFAVMVPYYLRADLWRKPKQTLTALGLVILPSLLVYPLFLPWVRSRTPTPIWWKPNTFGEWVDWLADRGDTQEAFVTQGIDRQLQVYWQILINDYTLIMVVFAILGLAVWLKQRTGLGLFILISFLLQSVLAANYRDNQTIYTYFPPSFIIIVFAAGYGMHVVWTWVEQLLLAYPSQKKARLPLAMLGSLVLVALPLHQFNDTYHLRYDEATRGYSLVGEQTQIGVATGKWRSTLKAGDMGERLARGLKNLPSNAILVSDWEQETILWYSQKIEGVRPDVTLIYPIEEVRNYITATQPLCISRAVNVAELVGQSMENWHPTNSDALICLQREPSTVIPEGIVPVNKIFSLRTGVPILELVGYRLGDPDNRFQVGKFVPLTLVWRALNDLDANYAISLQVRNENWALVDKWDTAHPVMGMYPTQFWQTGEIVQDYHEFDIPRSMKPAHYLWGLVVYQVHPDGSFENLGFFNADQTVFDEFVFVNTFEVFTR